MATKGFTLIEMIVIVGIIGILSTIVILQFNGTNKNFSLKNAQSIVRADLRRAMTYASTGKTCCTGQTTPAGYGVVFTPGNTTYQLYADIDGDHLYTAAGLDEVIETIDAQTGDVIVGTTPASDVDIDTCSPSQDASPVCDFSVSVPAGVLYANGVTGGSFAVTLRQTKGAVDATKTITVNLDSGKIE